MKDKSKIKDLTGQKYGLLTVIGLKDTDTRKTYWVCQCECGNIKEVRSDSLLCGAIKSCGCLKRAQDKVNLTKNHRHKMSGTRLYSEWQGMKGRCYNPHDPRYDRWGGRGITVCDEWRDSFEAFYEWSMSHGYAEDLTIDRIDNDMGYAPDNCRWATQIEQSRNRSSNINIRIGNSTRTLTEWCEIFQVDYKNVLSRYHRNGFIGIDDLFNRG
jgi:hypothetical protein